LATGAAEPFDATYLGERSRISLRHMQGVDWYVMAIAPNDLVDLPVTTMVLITLVGFFVLVLLAVVVACAGVVRRQAAEAGAEWVCLRPDARKAEGYCKLAI